MVNPFVRGNAHIVLVFLLCALAAPLALADFPPECPNGPGSVCVINQSTVLTPGNYSMPNGFRMSVSGVTLDCAGSTITGAGSGTGIAFGNSISNTVIKQCVLENYTTGVDLYGYDNSGNELYANTIRNVSVGIYVSRAFNNRIWGNDFMDIKDKAVYLFSRAACADLSPMYNRYYRNTFTHVQYGFYVEGQDGCSIVTSPKYETIENNTFQDANYSIRLLDHDVQTFFNITGNDFLSSNTLDVSMGTRNNEFSDNLFAGEGEQYAYTSNNFCASLNNSFSGNARHQGCDCISPSGSVMMEGHTTLCYDMYNGLQLSTYVPNLIVDCNNASLYGAPPSTAISLSFDNITVTNCNIYNYQTGIFSGSLYHNIHDNYLYNETYGLDIRKMDAEGADPTRQTQIYANRFERGSTGIYIAPSTNPPTPTQYQLITNNDFYKQSYGVYFGLSAYSTYVDVYANTFRNDTRGVFMYAPFNKIRNNTFDFNRNSTVIINSNNTLNNNTYTNTLSYAVTIRNANNVSLMDTIWDTTDPSEISRLIYDWCEKPSYGYGIWDAMYAGKCAPVLKSPGNKTIEENSTLTIQLNATDANPDVFTFGTDALALLPSSFSFNATKGLFIWKPTLSDAGQYFITFNVSDGALRDSQSIIITVTNFNGSVSCVNDSECSDGLWCNGVEQCNGNSCVNGTAVDCSGNNHVSIAMCTNDPDNNPYTWDSYGGFTSTCEEAVDACTTDTVSVTSTCNKASCGAQCETAGDCVDTCVNNVYSTSASCTSCSCSYGITQNCTQSTGWYNMSNTTWISNGACTELQQYEQEFRDYTCGVGCTFNVTQTQWQNSTTMRNKVDGTACDDAAYCTINDQCTSGSCGGSSRDCSANNIASIGMCTNDPDNNPYTWDSYAGFTSTCDENADSCTSGTVTVTNTCNKASCSAQCEVNPDCFATSCSITYNDSCNGKKLVEYDADKTQDSTTVSDSCANTCQTGCSCTSCSVSCPAPATNTYCVKNICGAACAVDADCNDGNAHTADSCDNTCSCAHAAIACFNNAECDDGNANTNDICQNPGTTSSSCSHVAYEPKVCIIRDGYTNLPVLNAADIGTGYAMSRKTGISDYTALKSACTESIYRSLLQQYCDAGQTRAAQWGVSILGQVTGCSQYGCGSYDCSYLTSGDLTPGACVVRSATTNLPSAGMADVGTGYVKKMMNGADDITALRSVCTTTVYQTLMSQYCGSGQSAPVQWETAVLGSTTGCAAQGCDYHSC